MEEAVEKLFEEAMGLGAKDREDYLRLQSQGNEPLVSQVLRLIADCEKAEAMLGTSIGRLANSFDPEPGTRIGAYILREKIGEGGMGIVYLADRADGQFEQRVAIKLVQGGASLTARFLRERQILARLVHPRIARLIDGGITEQGHPYMVMEYFAGEPISDYCRNGKLNVRQSLELFRRVCEAVEYAHRNLVVHRDLKPANILVSADGEIKLLDFGIAKLIDRRNNGDSTAAGLHLFTPDYASPEQIRGEEITTAADVYSLGTVLYELLAGRSPHRLKTYTPSEITQVICVDPAPELKLGNELDQIVAMALRKEPERRYPSVAAMSEDVGRFLSNHPVLARGDSAWYKTRKFLRRHYVPVIAAALAVLSLAAGLGVAAWQAKVAERRFTQVRKLARTVLFDFDAKIRDIAGSTAARDFLAKTAVEYLDSLSRDAAGDMGLKQELAAAYEKVGDVQGEPARPNLGQRQNALENYKKSLDLWKGMKEGQGQDLVASARLMLKRQAILGQKQLLDEGRAMAERAWQREPEREDALAVVVQAVQNTGQYFSNRSEFDEAIRQYRQAGEMATVWEKKWPGKRAELAGTGCWLRLGDAALRKGEPREALAAFDKAEAGNGRLLAGNPEDVEHLRRAFKLQFLKGHALGNPDYFHLGQTAEARRCYERAVALSEKLLKADPKSALARGDLSDAYWALAVTISPSEGKRAKLLLQDAVREAKAVSANSPATLAFIHNSANTQFALGGTLRHLGESGPAMEFTREAIRLQRDIVRSRPNQVGLRHNMMTSLTLLLHLQLDSRDLRAARVTWEEVLGITKTVERNASYRSKAADVAAAYAAAGRLHAEERSAEAPRWYRASLAIWDELEKSGVSGEYIGPKRRQTQAEMKQAMAKRR